MLHLDRETPEMAAQRAVSISRHRRTSEDVVQERLEKSATKETAAKWTMKGNVIFPEVFHGPKLYDRLQAELYEDFANAFDSIKPPVLSMSLPKITPITEGANNMEQIIARIKMAEELQSEQDGEYEQPEFYLMPHDYVVNAAKGIFRGLNSFVKGVANVFLRKEVFKERIISGSRATTHLTNSIVGFQEVTNKVS